MLRQKIEKLLQELKLTPEEFSTTVKVGKSSIYKLLRGDTKRITKNLAEKINSEFPQYSVEELLALNFEEIQEKVKDTIFIKSLNKEISTEELAILVAKNIDKLKKEKVFYNAFVIEALQLLKEAQKDDGTIDPTKLI